MTMGPGIRRTVELLCLVCFVSVLLTVVTLQSRGVHSPPEGRISRRGLSLDTEHETKVTHITIRQPSGFTRAKLENIGVSVVTMAMEIEKQIHSESAPQNRFQWLFADKSAFVYSSHYDNKRGIIKIIGFKHRSMKSNMTAKCVYPDGLSEPMTTLYNISVVTPREGLQYDTWIWKCQWHRGERPPATVNLVDTDHRSLANLSVTYHTWPAGPEKSTKPVVCVKPMVNNYSDAYQLKEFIELTQIMGASKIVLYPQSIDEVLIRPLIEHYKALGVVDSHDWKPPVPLKELHAFGQKSHNQHCLYTYKYRYQWAVFIDLDELIVTSNKIDSYEYMIQTGINSVAEKEVRGKIAGFTVRSQMCSISIPDDPIYKTASGKELCLLTSFRKTNCTLPMQPGIWSKPLVNTDGTEVVDIHAIRLPQPGYSIIELDPRIGTVHHYRALKHKSMLLAESRDRNVIKRNNHRYNEKAKEMMGPMCSNFNREIGDVKYAD